MNTNENHPGVLVLLKFLEELGAWDKESAELFENTDWDNATSDDYDAWFTDRRTRVVKLFETFCLAGAEAKRFDDPGVSFGGDESNGEGWQVLKVRVLGDDRVLVDLRANNGAALKQYEAHRQNETWGVADIERVKFSPEAEWSDSIL